MMKRATIVFLAACLMIALCGCTPSESQYTYASWARQAHYPTPCELQSVESNDREATAFLCKGTHKIPTKDQMVAWSSYTLWVSCYQYHSPYACQELTN